MTHPLVAMLREDLQAHADAKHAAGACLYLGEQFNAYGVRGGKKLVSRFLNRALASCPEFSFAQCLTIAEELLSSRKYEEGQAAILLLRRHTESYGAGELERFRKWIGLYVDNWGICDSFCLGVVWSAARANPQHASLLSTIWANEPNRWIRRAACVTLLRLNRYGEYVNDTIAISECLLARKEQDEMVMKAWGWMLKELTVRRQDMAMTYLLGRMRLLPPLVVTHALEKLSPSERAMLRSK